MGKRKIITNIAPHINFEIVKEWVVKGISRIGEYASSKGATSPYEVCKFIYEIMILGNELRRLATLTGVEELRICAKICDSLKEYVTSDEFHVIKYFRNTDSHPILNQFDLNILESELRKYSPKHPTPFIPIYEFTNGEKIAVLVYSLKVMDGMILLDSHLNKISYTKSLDPLSNQWLIVWTK